MTQELTSSELLPCPFCGWHMDGDMSDIAYPTGSYAHWIDPQDQSFGLHFNRERVGAEHDVWQVGCTGNMGGCGAKVTGLGRDGAIAAWNRRAAISTPAAMEQAPASVAASPADTVCSTHPDAPHGFNRNASLNADRYVCDCEGWEPEPVAPQAAREVVTVPRLTWRESEAIAGTEELSGDGNCFDTTSPGAEPMPGIPLHVIASVITPQPAMDAPSSLPDGVMFDALGEPRNRYVRVILDGTTMCLHPSELDYFIESESPDASYVLKDVYLSEREFDDLPEFDGF